MLFELCLHGVIEDSGRAEQEAEVHIARGLVEARDKARTGKTRFERQAERARREIAKWPAWKRRARLEDL